jgi:hypothetical protein
MDPWKLATSEWEWLDDTDDDLVIVEWVPQIRRQDANNISRGLYDVRPGHRRGYPGKGLPRGL